MRVGTVTTLSVPEQAWLVVAFVAILMAAFVIIDAIVVVILWAFGELRARGIVVPADDHTHIRVEPVPGCLTCEAASCVSTQALARHKAAEHGGSFA